MSHQSQSAFSNRVLARLSPGDFALLADGLEPVSYPLAMILAAPNEPIAHAVFLEAGVASIVVLSSEGQSAEGGVVGREGFIVPALALGSLAIPHRVEMQIGGHGHRIESAALLAASARSATLRDTLLRFAQCLMVQTAYTVLSNAAQDTDKRLARWILMCHDRSDSDDLALTHKFMAVMLSVRRPSVTDALHLLEGRGFIRTERGYVTIVNRVALEEFAGETYGKPEAEYRRLLGPL